MLAAMTQVGIHTAAFYRDTSSCSENRKTELRAHARSCYVRTRISKMLLSRWIACAKNVSCLQTWCRDSPGSHNCSVTLRHVLGMKAISCHRVGQVLQPQSRGRKQSVYVVRAFMPRMRLRAGPHWSRGPGDGCRPYPCSGGWWPPRPRDLEEERVFFFWLLGHHYIGSVAFDRTLKFWSTQAEE